MKLKSFNYSICLLVTLFFSPILSEEKIDIWNNNQKVNNEKKIKKSEEPLSNSNLKSNQTVEALDKIQIISNSKI